LLHVPLLSKDLPSVY